LGYQSLDEATDEDVEKERRKQEHPKQQAQEWCYNDAQQQWSQSASASWHRPGCGV